jgi:hypothetical protein
MYFFLAVIKKFISFSVYPPGYSTWEKLVYGWDMLGIGLRAFF